MQDGQLRLLAHRRAGSLRFMTLRNFHRGIQYLQLFDPSRRCNRWQDIYVLLNDKMAVHVSWVRHQNTHLCLYIFVFNDGCLFFGDRTTQLFQYDLFSRVQVEFLWIKERRPH